MKREVEKIRFGRAASSEVMEVEGEAGLRLMVGEWLSEWLCREVGGEIEDTGHQNSFKLVLAEPLGREGHVSRRVPIISYHSLFVSHLVMKAFYIGKPPGHRILLFRDGIQSRNNF